MKVKGFYRSFWGILQFYYLVYTGFTMCDTVWILGDQLSLRHSALQGRAPSECVVLMIESMERAKKYPFHKQKLTLVWSAMRHFAQELRGLGYAVDYYEMRPNFSDALREHLERYRPAHIYAMEPADWGGADRLLSLACALGADLRVLSNTMFISDRDQFVAWAANKRTLRMETFYRHMRRTTGLLMTPKGPAGDKWNYDAMNRQRPPVDRVFPGVPQFSPDPVTQSVMHSVEQAFPRHFGQVEDFAWPVTREGAHRFLDDFLDQRLPCFGPYEDAMVQGERVLCHSLLSPLLNLGLLDPLDVCQRAAARYQDGAAPLNSVEGFIRQIIGWREFIYQVYQLKMPTYADCNYFEADLPLPEFYWTADTRMICVADAIRTLSRYGINHHIQRLMITGNFALLAGINPQKVNAWYWLAYVDAYGWVVTPNVLGLALYADGGYLATKPYAASANYINRMSNYCKQCDYHHRVTIGKRACPFNVLYWDFLARNELQLQDNPRMNLMLGHLRRKDAASIQAIRAQATSIRRRLADGVAI